MHVLQDMGGLIWLLILKSINQEENIVHDKLAIRELENLTCNCKEILKTLFCHRTTKEN